MLEFSIVRRQISIVKCYYSLSGASILVRLTLTQPVCSYLPPRLDLLPGFLLGKDVPKLCGTMGLTLSAMLIKYYKENDNEKVYFETFKKIVSECFALWEESAEGTSRGHTTMDDEIKGKSGRVCIVLI
jgi:hypothetical protein